MLGKGGMGIVIAARHIDLGELFAVKFLLPAALAQPDAVERFLREARASARLKGEHVVKVQDVGRLPDGMPYMVMEHLSGSDLKAVVKERGPLPIADALTYMLQACEALAEAHALGIVHRDLKPANMFLIRRPNGTPCVKVLDFGISKQVVPENAEQEALTRTDMILGSPAYMSPEQMKRTKDADPRGDIWSMGVVLYMLLTGTLPFQGDAIELVGKVLQEEPLPPSHHRADIPPALDAVVLTCLQKDREHRYQTVDQLMEALRGTSVGADSQTGQSWGTTRRAAILNAPRPAQLAIVGALTVGSLLAVGVFSAARYLRSAGAPAAVSTASEPASTPSLAMTASSDAAPPVLDAGATAASASAAPASSVGSALPAAEKPDAGGERPNSIAEPGASAAPTTAPPAPKTTATAVVTAAPKTKKHDTMY